MSLVTERSVAGATGAAAPGGSGAAVRLAAPALLAEREAWLAHLAGERRLAANTVEAYRRDLDQFLAHMADGDGPPGLDALADLATADLRGFMARRRAGGVGSRTLARQLSSLRSFLDHCERRGLAGAAAARAVRTPRRPRSLPKPLPEAAARRVTAAAEQGCAEPWLDARNAAVMTLLYGCGLRIGEALSLTGGALRDPR